MKCNGPVTAFPPHIRRSVFRGNAVRWAPKRRSCVMLENVWLCQTLKSVAHWVASRCRAILEEAQRLVPGGSEQRVPALDKKC